MRLCSCLLIIFKSVEICISFIYFGGFWSVTLHLCKDLIFRGLTFMLYHSICSVPLCDLFKFVSLPIDLACISVNVGFVGQFLNTDITVWVLHCPTVGGVGRQWNSARMIGLTCCKLINRQCFKINVSCDFLITRDVF